MRRSLPRIFFFAFLIVSPLIVRADDVDDSRIYTKSCSYSVTKKKCGTAGCIAPFYKDNKLFGFRLYALCDTDLLVREFGLRNDDVVLAIDGQNVPSDGATQADLDRWLERLWKIRMAQEGKLRILRGKKSQIDLVVPKICITNQEKWQKAD